MLSNEAKGCRYLVLWLDCDLEGENICFEVIDAVRRSMGLNDKKFLDRIFRYGFFFLL